MSKTTRKPSSHSKDANTQSESDAVSASAIHSTADLIHSFATVDDKPFDWEHVVRSWQAIRPHSTGFGDLPFWIGVAQIIASKNPSPEDTDTLTGLIWM